MIAIISSNHVYTDIDRINVEDSRKHGFFKSLGAFCFLVFVGLIGMKFYISMPKVVVLQVENDFHEATTPFSTADPTSMAMWRIDRTPDSKPGEIFGDLRENTIPLPTNSWCQNFFLGYGKTEMHRIILLGKTFLRKSN